MTKEYNLLIDKGCISGTVKSMATDINRLGAEGYMIKSISTNIIPAPKIHCLLTDTIQIFVEYESVIEKSRREVKP